MAERLWKAHIDIEDLFDDSELYDLGEDLCPDCGEDCFSCECEDSYDSSDFRRDAGF